MPSKLGNSLSDDVNLTLFSTDNVAACVNVLFEHLATSVPLSRSAQPPVRWDPDRRAIVDPRDGRIDTKTNSQVLRFY